ncbi:MAG TPA: DNA polymerase III subunit alpha [Candidatus Avichristensenella intestinipullorum]|uniref:DNA polymerase III subunit alpha n=1 Tax=Candidatus Avichristensenella intestinipullorum TaxID=2840693 RepID=A0A9D0YX93_9FIRM|nr:DNA polymerase III subunit alpha [Candidatus Avichristensenella intestinipullorum]
MSSFVHLHLHTEYSLLDGANPIAKTLDRVKELGMDACAITDHGVMYGVVDFYAEARKRGIHPVIGCEVYVCEDMEEKTSAAREYNHLILLCETQEGYRSLTRLVSEAWTRGFYYKPRVDYSLLRRHHEGLIALSACLSGEIPQALLEGREETARQAVARYLDIFGRDNFFIEIQDHGLADERTVLPQLVRLARETGVALVATNDAHYLRREDAEAQEVLMCIQTGKTLEDENRLRMSTRELYVKSPEEMAALFPQWPEALENTVAIARRCHVAFDFSTVHLPRYPLEPGQTAEGLLRSLCAEGLARLYPKDDGAARERLEYELGIIIKMGYVDYFLIVWDFIRYAKEHGIMVGPGRGSGAGSITAYTLGITALDPLKYNLLFERFLNPERISMPDIDTDFCYERRQEVIDYVARRYGEDHVAQIITFGTMAAKAVIRDVGRVLGYPYAEVDAVAKMIPFSLDMTLDKALSISPELRRQYEENPRTRRLVDTARALEGMPRHASTHAAGVLITRRPVTDYVPLQTNDDVVTTQFPMGTLEKLGLLKMDILGLRTLTVIRDTLDMMRQMGVDMKPEEIPMDDKGVYDMICQGDTDGVFQLESGGMRAFLANMKPDCFEDIIAAISLYRPGPMDSIPRYIEGKHNPESIRYADERLRPILEVTYGCMVYQEQVMQIVRDLAGYSLGRSDLVRRAMAKKKKDVMAQEREYFIHGMVEDGRVIVPGAVRNGVPEDVAARIFDEMTAFASYAFNKPHAACYAVVAVQTGWLKLHYPAQFMAALMNSVTGSAEKIAQYIQYCRKHGIAVLPPDVNRSGRKFSVEFDAATRRPAIRFGLGAVKGAGAAALDAIVREREARGPFRDIYDFAQRATDEHLNKRMVEALIRAGAFDATGANRAQLLDVYERALDGAAQVRKKNVAGQLSLFGALEDDMSASGVRPRLPRLPEHPRRVLLAMEKETTGVYITGHPLDEYRETLEAMEFSAAFIDGLTEREDRGVAFDGRRIRLGGLLADVRSKATRANSLMGFVILEDLTGQIEGMVFPKTWERLSMELTQDRPVVLAGRLSMHEDEAPKLIVEEVYPLQKTGEKPSPAQDVSPSPAQAPPASSAAPPKLYLRVRARADMERALPLLEGKPGPSPALFYLETERITLRAPERYWCDADEALLQALRDCLGAENVKLRNGETAR